MNERIRELAIQSIAVWNAERQQYEVEPDELAKFAELIVKECADIAKHHVMNMSTYSDADFVEKQIQEHFGVGE